MRKFFLSAVAAIPLFAGAVSASENNLIGVVNFTTCVTDSKIGKKEQENMENLRNQLTSLVENTNKELREIAAKFEDSEYLDSLSPKAEEELKQKFESLQEDLSRYQSQAYQVMNGANYQMIQKMSNSIGKAAEKIAKQKKLDYVMNKEACFYIRPDLDVTASVISEMDKNFDNDMKTKKLSDNSDEALPLNAIEETMLDKAG